MVRMNRPQKIIFGEMRASGVSALLTAPTTAGGTPTPIGLLRRLQPWR
jgi:hypothetical protein